MRLPDSAHTDRPWRVHQITADFHLEDVWALPVRGGPDGLDEVVRRFGSGESPLRLPGVAGLLWAIRQWLGVRLGWDRAEAGLGNRVRSLRDRLPADLPAAPDDPARTTGPFRPIFSTHDEWAAELANRTVHGVLHLGWVADDDGSYFAQMAVLVRPNGRLGTLYMAGIAPLRHRVVYPQLMRSLERARRNERQVHRVRVGEHEEGRMGRAAARDQAFADLVRQVADPLFLDERAGGRLGAAWARVSGRAGGGRGPT